VTAGVPRNSFRRSIGAAVAAGALALAGATSALSSGAFTETHPQIARASGAKCATGELVVWLDTRGDAAAGSVYYGLKFTNMSGHACTLVGYPGVSAVDLARHQLGSAASRNPSQARSVRLARGATATAVLQIVTAGNFPTSTCHRVKAAGLRVYPPNQTASKVVPFPFDACSRRGPVYLRVAAVTNGP
jgi:hypothetical protein